MNLPKFVSKLIVIFAAFSVSILWLFLIIKGLKAVTSFSPYGGYSLTPIGIFFFSCIFAPLWEELAFRHAPLLIAKRFSKPGRDVTWPIIIISSVIFGWGHGSGPISLLIQGVGGLLFSWVYLKNNYSYWSSTFLHFLWNFSLTFVFPTIVSNYGIKITIW